MTERTPRLTAYVVDTTLVETVTVRQRLPDGTLDTAETTIQRVPRHRGDILARSDDDADLTVLPAGSYAVVEAVDAIAV